MKTTRRPRKNSTTEAHILEAAQRQFAHYGFSKVTMDEIAHEIGMGKASLYYYFRTKESLFQAVIIHEHRHFMNSVTEKVDENISASDKIRTYVVERYEYFNMLMNLNILDLQSSVKMKPIFSTTFDEFAKQELKLLRRIIQAGCTNDEFTVTSVEKVAQALLHTMQGHRCRFLRGVDRVGVNTKEYNILRQELCFVTEIFLRGITT
jgi:TetR/AcrR family transcriptional repressor of mexJK operon